MSCPNNDCNTACTCSQCCPPVPPPIPPTPPSCIGTECDEIYDAACVKYTGATIDCLNIPNGASLNSIINTLALKLCDCTTGRCLSPLEFFFNRLSSLYNNAKVYNIGLTIKDVYEEIITNGGLVLKKCNYCCPDGAFYALSIDPNSRDKILYDLFTDLEMQIQLPVINNNLNYTECATTFLTLFDSTLENLVTALTPSALYEFAGFNGQSALCELNTLLPSLFTYEEITDIVYKIYEHDLFIACDSINGNIFIGSRNTYKDYLCNMESNCII